MSLFLTGRWLCFHYRCLQLSHSSNTPKYEFDKMNYVLNSEHKIINWLLPLLTASYLGPGYLVNWGPVTKAFVSKVTSLMLGLGPKDPY